jgi:ABC-type transporter Mla subunit MlaD
VRRITAGLCCVGALGLFVFGTGASGDTDGYQVRAIFDNGAFLVKGEEVRIAGARVGQVSSVDVTGVDEAAHADGSPEPGKAAVVLQIDDPAFQDFRQDATCLIRPQSLLGEKFVECKPTEPRAPGSKPPPRLSVIGDGSVGAGQRFLPLEQNGKSVDLDLVNNIMREPYAERFRLIINDLGAGLAARGDDLAAVIKRANPALRQTDEVLRILAEENHQLATLARDSDTILAPLVRQRQHVQGFINNAATTAQATAERSADLEEGLQKLPETLRELRPTMTSLASFSDQAAPVVADLGVAAPDLTRITKALGPFSRGGTAALTSLGDAADKAGPDLKHSEPVLADLEKLAKGSRPVSSQLRKLLGSLRKTGGFKYLAQTIFNVVGTLNIYDSYGHFLRTTLPVNNCVDYAANRGNGGGISCDAQWQISAKAKTKRWSHADVLRAVAAERAMGQGRLAPRNAKGQGESQPAASRHRRGSDHGHDSDPVAATAEAAASAVVGSPVPGAGAEEQTSPDSLAPKMHDAEVFLDFFMGSAKGAER